MGPQDVMAQIAGQPGAIPGAGAAANVPGPQGLLPPGVAPGAPPSVIPQVPQGAQAPQQALQQGVDPNAQAMQELAVAADAMFQQQFGVSALELMQSGQISPEQEAAFSQIIEQIVSGTTTGEQEFANTSPAGLF